MSENPQQEVAAYQPDQSLRNLVGKYIPLSTIFTQERMAACDKHITEAKANFFEVTQNDMMVISEKIAANKQSGNLQLLYADISPSLCNIKGQAEMFSFPLIKTICKHLMNYCEETSSGKTLSTKEAFVVDKLFEALSHCLNNRITDRDGKFEKQLEAIIATARK